MVACARARCEVKSAALELSAPKAVGSARCDARCGRATGEAWTVAEDCLFCRIAGGSIPSTEVYSDDEFYAFRDIHPGAPVHVLIVPRKHIPRITAAEPEDAALLGRMLLRANDIAAREGIAEPGFRFVINCNADGGQTVFHIHLHILGGRGLAWPPG